AGDERKKARIVRLDGCPGANGSLATDTGATGAESRRLPRPVCGFSPSIAIAGDVASDLAPPAAPGPPAPGWPASNRQPPGIRDGSPAFGPVRPAVVTPGSDAPGKGG